MADEPELARGPESSVDHDALTLHVMRSTLPDYQGISDDVFQRALYMTS